MLVLFLTLLMTMSSVFAITAKIGNARAILNGETGDTLERTIKVINDNDVDVRIELFAGGDLADDIKIIDNNFTLAPGEERNARFEIYLREPGKTESNINVKFTAVDDDQGVGLSSTLIVNTVEGPGFFDNLFDGNDEEDNTVLTNSDSTTSGEKSLGISSGVLLIIVLLLILVALVVIFFYLKKRAEYSKGFTKTKLKKNVRKK